MLPEHLRQVLAAPAGSFPRQPQMTLFVGGAATRQELLDQARERITARLYNSLGSTEAATFAQTLLVTPEDRRWHQLIPERDPQLVDEADQPTPQGQIGRVRVSTRGGPQGYLGDAASTSRFFRDGYFYPGDLGVIRADGRMALMGRTTDVINVLGQKLSPAPFEDELCERLGVSGACLFASPDDAGEEELHLVLETDAPPSADRLRRAVRETLIGFPHARVHFATALPRNAGGKLLRAEVRRRLSQGASATP